MNNKYIQKTKSGKFRVCFPRNIKWPRGLGTFPSVEIARQERDKYLASQGIESDVELSTVDKKDVLNIDAHTILAGFDLHSPYQDDGTVNIFLQVAQKEQPDTIVLGGDITDFYKLSRFSQDEKRSQSIQSELDSCYSVLKSIRDVCPNAKIYHLLGNHEKRLHSYLCANSELASLRALQLETLMHFDELGIVHTKELRLMDNRLVFVHGRYTSINSGSAAKKEAKTRGFQQTIVQGHGHRFGQFELNGPLYHLAGFEIGCMCKDSWYDDDSYWMRGFCVVTIDGDYSVENVYVRDGKALFRGRAYRV